MFSGEAIANSLLAGAPPMYIYIYICRIKVTPANEVITSLDKIDEVVTSSEKIDEVITSSYKCDEVITSTKKSCRSYFRSTKYQITNDI